MLDPLNFGSVIDNPYFPLPVGRTLVYRGVREGQSQVDPVTVTSRTRVAEGITARVSWRADVSDAEPGIIMEADPQVPDAYRQEYLKGQAEDTAWIVIRGGSTTVPYGTVHNILTSLEFARIEPHVVDRKVYAPGIGIVREKALSGDQETSKLVKVIG